MGIGQDWLFHAAWIGALLALSGISYCWSRRCNDCGRWFALVKTGEKTFPGGTKYARFVCRHCHSRPWAELPPDRRQRDQNPLNDSFDH